MGYICKHDGGIPNAEIDELSMYWDAFPELRDLYLLVMVRLIPV